MPVNVDAVPFLVVAVAGLTWWLGLYLLVRDPRAAVSRRAGVGLLGYAAALATQLLLDDDRLLVVFCVPALAWTGACVRLLPEAFEHRDRLDRLWLWIAVPVTAVAAVPVLLGGGAVAYLVLAVVVLTPLLGVLVLLALGLGLGPSAQQVRTAPVGTVLAVATLFFALGSALVLLPLGWLPTLPMLLAVDVDLLTLGLAVAWCEAFDAGETLRRDMLRSLLAAAVAAMLFGGQVVLVMLTGPGATPPLNALLMGTVAAAVAVQVLAAPAHGLLDRLAFTGVPDLARQRAQLRSVAAALPRRDERVLPAGVDAEEFVRLTRRALASYGDLARLTASPLVNLPAIDERLADRRAPDQPLERAAELKALLLASIRRLKPKDGEFGSSDEWRYYNALYFPYVVGLKPYRRTTDRRGLDPVSRQAYDWFATQVPERTLHNWQNAAARLVAADLRGGTERSLAELSRD